jgi:hypothetical protein
LEKVMEELNQELARAAYERFLPAAMALPAERVQPFRVDPDLAIINVNKAVSVLDRVRARMAEHLPKISVEELEGLPSLALAVKAAALAAEHAVVEITPGQMISEGWKLRATLLPVVAALAATGVIPQAVHDNIVRGRGVRDMAEDCVALSHVFRDYAAEVAGKHAADPAMIARAESVGSWLLQNLRKKHAPPESATTPESDIRDRMATLLGERYSNLRAVAYYFFRDDHDDHVPSLMSRRLTRKREPGIQPAPRPAPIPAA